MTEEELLTWFRERGKYFNLERIATELNIPRSSLRAWVAGKRPLATDHVPKLLAWIKIFRE